MTITTHAPFTPTSLVDNHLASIQVLVRYASLAFPSLCHNLKVPFPSFLYKSLSGNVRILLLSFFDTEVSFPPCYKFALIYRNVGTKP